MENSVGTSQETNIEPVGTKGITIPLHATNITITVHEPHSNCYASICMIGPGGGINIVTAEEDKDKKTVITLTPNHHESSFSRYGYNIGKVIALLKKTQSEGIGVEVSCEESEQTIEVLAGRLTTAFDAMLAAEIAFVEKKAEVQGELKQLIGRYIVLGCDGPVKLIGVGEIIGKEEVWIKLFIQKDQSRSSQTEEWVTLEKLAKTKIV
ncbi:MAG: hypothetical protein WC285_03660 [Candidatus Gracilibacteria bacterium]|jgi:hypothetical protein